MNIIFMFIVIVMNNRLVIAAPKSIQATVTLLENLHIILEKTPPSDIRAEILPLLFNSFESNTMQIQSAALLAVANVYEYVDEVSIRRMVLPKIKTVFEKNQSDLKIMANVLQCIERVLDKLEKSQIIDEVLPMLYEIRLSDPEIILRIVRKLSELFCAFGNDFAEGFTLMREFSRLKIFCCGHWMWNLINYTNLIIAEILLTFKSLILTCFSRNLYFLYCNLISQLTFWG